MTSQQPTDSSDLEVFGFPDNGVINRCELCVLKTTVIESSFVLVDNPGLMGGTNTKTSGKRTRSDSEEEQDQCTRVIDVPKRYVQCEQIACNIKLSCTCQVTYTDAGVLLL